MSSSRSKCVKRRSKRKSRASCAWHRATQAGQIMQLAEHAGERRLAALVGTGNDEDALRAGQKEIVGHDGSPFADELARQREVECLAAVDLLRRLRELRLAEAQAGTPEFVDIREVGNVELDLAVEARNLFVKILRVRRAKGIEGAERVWMQHRHPIQHLGLDMVKAPSLRDLDPIVVHRVAPEFLKGLFDSVAVIALCVVVANRDAAVTFDEQAVSDGGQI